jgi:predicted O-methyltransferase YrrM
MHPTVIAYLSRLLRPEYTVVEHGSGGSTLWLAERVAHVYSVEHDQDWYAEMCKRLPANVKLYLTPDGEIPQALPLADVLLIDGEPLKARSEWLREARRMVKPGGVVVLDNANRPDYAHQREMLRTHALQCITFDGNEKGTRYLVTDVYLLPGVREWL